MEQTEQNNGFLTEKQSLLLDEIKGLIIQTSRAISTAQREMKMNGINVRNKDAYPVANFYYYFNNLYMLTRDLITDEKLKTNVYKWLNVDFYYTTDTKKIIEMFNSGKKLFDSLDNHLYTIGIKDTNKTGTSRFPFDYYARLLDE